ncbi:hypothetical protein FG379_002050 [Cryptosporidium bovis]|uniref:uncharacterized protein n=1 Tax=Cryptosporidium bovis TaxID=310047 RepID=UPI00351A930C|nr:hypothetical protein FG379_002050 [Cryptosporidium bovis]
MDFLKDLLYFWKTSPVGTPTLTFLIFVFALYVIRRLLFPGFRRTVAPKEYVSKFDSILIEGIEGEIGKLAKKFIKQKNGGKLNNYTSSEIEELDNSVRKVIQTSSEITESLYNFLSAFHASYGDFPDSNELTQYKTQIDLVSSSSGVDDCTQCQGVTDVMNCSGGKKMVCDFRGDFSCNDQNCGSGLTWKTGTITGNSSYTENQYEPYIDDTGNKLVPTDSHMDYNPGTNIYSDLI